MDNAAAESFFGSFKGELLDDQTWPTRAAARRVITEYVAWYNGTRPHSELGYRAPPGLQPTSRPPPRDQQLEDLSRIP